MAIHRSVAALILVVGVVGTSRAQTEVRVATWNIESIGARGSAQYNAELATLQRICADVVAINEVDGTELDDFQNLAADAGYDYTLVPTTNPFGSLRNGFMSKYAFARQTINTSAALSGDSQANDLTRLILEVVIRVPGANELTLLTEHWKSGDTDNDEFRRAVESIRMTQTVRDLRPAADAYIFMGDMNESIHDVPRSPNPFQSIPPGMPNGWRLGADIQAILSGVGLTNDPFSYLTSTSGPAVHILEARQKDGREATRDSSGRRIDYILVSAPLAAFSPPSEVYDSRDEGLSGGLPKCGSPLPSNTSASASDHFLVFADITIPQTCSSFGDTDCDGDVDLFDFQQFQNCFSGANVPAGAECAAEFDSNGDGDVDRPDYRAFWQNLTGP